MKDYIKLRDEKAVVVGINKQADRIVLERSDWTPFDSITGLPNGPACVEYCVPHIRKELEQAIVNVKVAEEIVASKRALLEDALAIGLPDEDEETYNQRIYDREQAKSTK